MQEKSSWRGAKGRAAEGLIQERSGRANRPAHLRNGDGEAARDGAVGDAQVRISDKRNGTVDGRRWFAVHTHPNRESTAARYLAYQGFAVFLPQRFKTRRHARRVETVLTAYFPCYLFVSFDPTRDHWRVINSTFGVRHLVMSGSTPEAVPQGLVEQMIARTDGAGILCLQQDVDEGQPVMVTGGPFADLVGTLEQLSPADRVSVLLDILGGVSLTLPRNTVAPISR